MDLVGTTRNPVPAGAAAGMLSSFDGTRLRTAAWPATAGERKGTVCLFGGRAEFIEKYFETVAELRRRGFAVATMDWRGQGGSQRRLKNPRKGHVEDFSEYDRDLDVFMSETVLPDCPPPYFALAHSMGGNVLLRAACRQDCWFERMVLSAPMLELAGRRLPAPLAARLCGAAVFLGLGDAYIPRGGDAGWEAEPFEGNVLTGDERRFTRNREVLNEAPELGLGAPTLAWARAAFASMQHVTGPAFPATVHVPVLMLAAGRDAVVSSAAVETLAAQLRAGAHVPLAGARHEILQERDSIRARFWAAFDAFVPGER